MDQSKNLIEVGFTFDLLADYQRARSQLDGPDGQFWRRTAFRSAFAFLEAWMSVNRDHMIPDAIRVRGDSFLKTEEDRQYFEGLLAATDPVEWTLTDKGTGKRVERKTAFLPLLKAIIRLAFCVNGAQREEVDRLFGCAEWEKLRSAVRVRDRLTHPHEHADLTVSDDDVSCLLGFADWMAQRIIRAVRYGDLPARYDDGERTADA